MRFTGASGLCGELSFISVTVPVEASLQLNVASDLTGIAQHASQYSTEGDCKCNDALPLYFTEREGEAVVASALTTPPAGGTENGSPSFGLFTDYVFTFFQMLVRLLRHKLDKWDQIQRKTGLMHICMLQHCYWAGPEESTTLITSK